MKKRTVQNNGKTTKGFQKGNQYCFQPGQSGNPGGRPKKDIEAEIAQRVFEENADAIYRAMLKALLKGDPECLQSWRTGRLENVPRGWRSQG